MSSVVLGIDTKTEEFVTIGDLERRQGLYVIGSNGFGKSNLFLNMVLQDITSGAGLCVLDPHGSLVDDILFSFPREREKDLIYLDVGHSEYPFGLNIFECDDSSDQNLVDNLVSQFVDIMKDIFGEKSFGWRLAQILRNSAKTLIANQGYTIVDIPRLLLDDDFRTSLIDNLTDDEALQFWELQFNRWSKNDRFDFTGSTLDRIDAFLTRTVRNIVGQSHSTIDLKEIIDSGKILLVDLAATDVGKEPANLIGSLFAAQIFNAAYSRQDLSNPRQFNLYVDEFYQLSSEVFEPLMTEGRKFGLATAISHQHRGQLTYETKGTTLNAANLVVFKVSGKDADELAREFDSTPPPPDVTGQRPIQTVCPKPVDFLLRSGHTDNYVTDLAVKHLKPLTKWAQEVHDDGWLAKGEENGTYYYSTKRNLQTGLELVDSYFFESMSHKIHPFGKDARSYLLRIVHCLRGYIDFSPEFLWVTSRPGPDYDIPIKLLTAVHEWLEKLMGLFANPPKPYDYSRSPEVNHYYWSTQVHKEQPERFCDPHSIINIRVDDLLALHAHYSELDDSGTSDEVKSKMQAQARDEYNSLRTFATAILAIAGRIYDFPIMVNSGQFEPIYGPQRTYADMQNEIATKLANLPVWHARCKVLQKGRPFEATIITLSPPKKTNSVSYPSLEYCRPKEEVEEEIRERGRRDEPPSPLSRRTKI